MRWAFSIYDVNGDGIITVKEVKAIIRSIQMLVNAVGDKNMSDSKIEYMFDHLDANHDGYLTLNEFMRGSKANPQFMKLLNDYIGGS